MPILRIPTPLRSYTGGQVEVQVNARSVGEAVEKLVEMFPTLKPHLYNDDGRLRPFVNLFVGEHNIKDLDGLATPVAEDTRVLVVPSIAGC
jgi:molybdopterin converting factor small subunit